MKKKILKKSKGRCFSAKNSQRIYIISINNMRQFFCQKAPSQWPAGLFFEKLVGGLEAYNHEKENFKKDKGKVLFGKKKSTNLYYFY